MNPADQNAPSFAEPWQAEAFALAVRLSAQGHFTWTEWASALAEQLQMDSEQRDPQRGEPDDGPRYYLAWLAALEHLVIEKQLSDRPALLARKQEWADAYARTPHGRPVELQHASNQH